MSEKNEFGKNEVAMELKNHKERRFGFYYSRAQSFPTRQIFLAFLLILLSHCGAVNTSKTTPGTFTSVYSEVLSQGCMQCHVPGGSATVDGHVQLNFTSQTTAYTTLTAGTVSSLGSSGTCGTVKLVQPKDPKNSYMMATLFTDYFKQNFVAAGCTPYTHQATNLNADEEASIVTWITNGAAND